MRKFAAALLLCCLMVSTMAIAEPTVPDATQPIRGLRRLSEAYADGQRLSWEASLSLTDYLGVDKAARELISGLLANLSARYEVQEGASETREMLRIQGGEKTLLSLTRWLRDGTEWVSSPAWDATLAADEGTGLLEALFGEAARYWPQEGTASQEPLSDWTRVRAGLSPIGSPEEGYACLLEGEAGIEAALALLHLLQVDAPDAPFQWIHIPTSIAATEPVSIYWMEDAEGRLTQARLAASFWAEAGEPWVLSLSLKHSYPKNGAQWELTGQASRGEDRLELRWSDNTTLSGKQVKRQTRLRAEGTLAGGPVALDMRQNDTNTFALSEEGLTEKLTRSLTIASSYKSEAARASGWDALSLESKEKSTLFTDDEAVQYAGTLEMKLDNGGNSILAGILSFVGDASSPVEWTEPTQVQRAALADEAQRAALAGQGQALLQQALTSWTAGLPAETRQLLLLP